ncbi:hypothetical protein MMC07_009544 [Pseudocyphellaria aurata]|nr:hypothetical protein [Pseudocyphellaria aurata]
MVGRDSVFPDCGGRDEAAGAFPPYKDRSSLPAPLVSKKIPPKINGNAYKACFWILSHLVPTLLSSIRAEIIPVVKEGTTDLETRLERCRRLEAIFNEIDSLTSSSSSILNVTSTMGNGDKTLHKDTKVLISNRQLHLNDDIFDSDSLHSNAERFLPDKDLSRGSVYRPFGGGVTTVRVALLLGGR